MWQSGSGEITHYLFSLVYIAVFHSHASWVCENPFIPPVIWSALKCMHQAPNAVLAVWEPCCGIAETWTPWWSSNLMKITSLNLQECLFVPVMTNKHSHTYRHTQRVACPIIQNHKWAGQLDIINLKLKKNMSASCSVMHGNVCYD